jgi:phytoene desaturase
MNSNSVIVIGAGIGGIATAAHLAHHGYHVIVLEKNRQPGGRCNRFSRDGHHFDSGPTLFIMPLVYQAEFASLGASLHEMLELRRVDPTYHLVFDDGSQLALTSDLDRMREQLEAIEPGSMDGFLRYLEEGHRHYEIGMARMAERDFRAATDFFSLDNLPLLFSLKPLVPHYQHMSDFFTNPRLKEAFTFQDVYMGLSPFDAPATFSMMPYTLRAACTASSRRSWRLRVGRASSLSLARPSSASMSPVRARKASFLTMGDTSMRTVSSPTPTYPTCITNCFPTTTTPTN